MKVKILNNVIKPEDLKPSTEGSAAIDLRACLKAEIRLWPNDQAMIHTGIAVAIPRGFAGIIIPRSGLGTKGVVLGNGTGLIDSDYRGEIKVCLLNRHLDGQPHTIKHLDRIAQLFIVPVDTSIEVVEELDSTDRGTNGFGSTGVS